MRYAKNLMGLMFLLAMQSAAQTLSLSVSQLDFGTKQTNVKDSLSFRIRNAGDGSVTVSDINTYKSAFTVRDTAFTVPAHDSVTAWVYFKTNQNVSWSDVLTVENNTGRGPLTLRLKGTGNYNETLYATTQNLWENALKTALLALVNNHTVLGYNTARDKMFETVDDYGLNDTIECVYSGRRIYAPTRTIAQNLGFNTEHTWPQSFFNSADPMVSDLNHLYPTDAEPNNRRANYAFGNVANITWQDGTSKLGTRSTGETVFEPRLTHKGDVARALFYFLIRYPSNYGGFMTVNQETDLRGWDKLDTVSAKERQRNNSVATFQGKRNPLIDHPEFTDRITWYYTSAAPTLAAGIAPSPASAVFGNAAAGDSSEFGLVLVNKGRGTLTVSSVALQSASAFFSIVSWPSSVAADTFGVVRVRFKPGAAGQLYSNALVITNNDGTRPSLTVPVSGTGIQQAVAVRANVKLLLQGAYDAVSGVMLTSLNTGGVLASHFSGVTIPSKAVDSISIEIRDAQTAAGSTIRIFQPAWLLNDGTIVSFSDSTKAYTSYSAASGSYYVAAWHRNHLAVMTAAAQSLSGSVQPAYDFTIAQSQAYGTSPMVLVNPGVYAMYAGDANQSGVVTSADANGVFGALNTTGYDVNDVNLSGVVTSADANMVFGNLNVGSQVP